MFLNVLSSHQLNILRKLINLNVFEKSYLAGGTALAIQLGHRFSEDFDFFSPFEFDSQDIISKLEETFQVEVLYSSSNTLHLLIDGVKVTQLYYPNPLLSDLVNVDEIKGLMLASNIDIGLMKLIAISSRGSKKDFIDLYCLCKTGIKLKELINLLPYKFPGKSINIYHIIVSLCYFEEAEKEAMPKMYIKVEWDEVKKFFINESKIFKEML